MPGKLWRAPTVVPSIAYDDVPAAIDFLTRAFGFHERADARLTGDSFVLAFMDVGDGQISLSTSGRRDYQSPKSAGTTTQSVKVYVVNVDRHFAQAKAAGAEIIAEPRDQFWGGRTYNAKDLEGHYWEFSQIDRELDPSEWKLPPGIKLGK